MERKAAISGINFGTTKNHIVRAALESISYQIADVIIAMEKDADITLKALMADGGITANQFVIQFLADLLRKDVATIGMPDISALGAAYLAGLHTGMYESLSKLKQLNSNRKIYQPGDAAGLAENGYHGWKHAIKTGT